MRSSRVRRRASASGDAGPAGVREALVGAARVGAAAHLLEERGALELEGRAALGIAALGDPLGQQLGEPLALAALAERGFEAGEGAGARVAGEPAERFAVEAHRLGGPRQALAEQLGAAERELARLGAALGEAAAPRAQAGGEVFVARRLLEEPLEGGHGLGPRPGLVHQALDHGQRAVGVADTL